MSQSPQLPSHLSPAPLGGMWKALEEAGPHLWDLEPEVLVTPASIF